MNQGRGILQFNYAEKKYRVITFLPNFDMLYKGKK